MANPVKVNVAFVRARWGSARTDVPNLARWPLSVIEEVFQTRNGWSLGSYWDECSLGLRSLQFTFFDLGILKGDQHQKRDETIAAARKQCIDRNIPIAQYEHVVFLVDPANNDAGALGQGQDALFDQDASHEFFAHELGHVLGLDHAFGFIDGKETN
jgi:hypothetical protein